MIDEPGMELLSLFQTDWLLNLIESFVPQNLKTTTVLKL